MAGYTRVSSADIQPNQIVKAAPINAEYNAIRDAFAQGSGHRHDGTTAEGAYVPLIADLDANNKVAIDTTTNTVTFYVEVSAAPVAQFKVQDGAIIPSTDNDIDLGSASVEFKNLYLDGTANVDVLVVDESASISTDLTVNGNTVLGNASSDTVTVTASFNTGLIPSTDSAFNLGSTSFYWSNAYIDAITTTGNVTVGGAVTTTGNTTVGTNLAVSGTSTFTGLVTAGNLTTTGTSTHATVDINGGAIDGTVIGATTKAAGSFTTVTTTGQATLATADINGGTVDGATIGATTPASIVGTTITANSGFVGNVTGNVTGNTAGTHTGPVVGNVTGNVTAASGSSSFNDVTINGTLNMNAGTTATITNLTSPTNTNDAATKGYVDTSISNLIDSAPGTLDTLNELAAALGDDPNFATTITTSIATKLPLAGGTMTGVIDMGTNKITGLGNPTAAQDAATKTYVDTNFLGLSGGTMTGAIDMGSSKIITTYTPVDNADLVNKLYVDNVTGSLVDAAASAAAAAASEANAATSETNAANSESAAAASATAAAASYDSFDDRYLGAKATPPTVDNDGDPLITGALFFDTTANLMKVYDGSSWVDAGSAVNGTAERNVYTATNGQTSFAATYDVGFVDVYLNGLKLTAGTDYTATDGTTVVLTSGAAGGDIVDIVAYGAFNIANTYTQTQADARFLQATNNLSDLDNAVTARTNLGVAIGVDVEAYDATILKSANIGSSVQGHSAALDDISGLAVTDGNIIVADGANWVAESGATARASLGLTIGADVQAYDANLSTINQALSTTSSPTFITQTVTTLSFANWTVTESGGSLYFATGGVNKMKLDSSGNLTVVGNVNANATIT